ncbi:multidrug efflux MATE transporter AbeM [uncultured Acinetobacter sp.]|uniref:multidrug efflux MATE transporter AbeM n=1 Tax=uncultured Acinetobacter sp. TaxID=165433 RepID=UPI00258BA702|nr:multidrug efflux MATE transporter AbeM [uncultured Acinetobacter sp.]
MSNVTSFRTELKQLFHLMLPILITQFAQAGFGLIDTIMAGHLSAADLAAIAVGVGLWIPVMLLFSGIMIATTPLVAEAKGARNTEQIPVIVRQSLWVAIILGVMAMLILQLMPFFLHVFGVPESLRPKASLFLHAIGLGMPAVTMYAALRGYSEALGHPRPVTAISLLALVVLIPLNMIFMHGLGPIPALGSAGCGFATSILQWLMLITLAGYIYKASAYRNTSIFSRFDKINLTWVKRILQLGLPIGLAVFFEVSIFSTGALVLSPLGEVFIAAHQVAISVTSVLFMIPLSLAIALTIRVGTYYGEKNWASMYQVQKIGLSTAVFFALLTMSFITLGREQIVSVYTQDINVVPVAMYLLWFAMGYQLMDALQVSAAGCLRGMQDTQAPMWITLMAYWVIAFPIGLYLARYTHWGVAGVWLGLIIGLSIACVLLLSRLYLNTKRLSQT